jgi:hypothetical protein
VARPEEQELTVGTRAFVEAHSQRPNRRATNAAEVIYRSDLFGGTHAWRVSVKNVRVAALWASD